MRLTAALLVLALVFSGTVNAMPERFFRPGDPLNANDVNNIVDGLLHQITGGKGIQVRTFGDRLIVSKDAQTRAPKVPCPSRIMTEEISALYHDATTDVLFIGAHVAGGPTRIYRYSGEGEVDTGDYETILGDTVWDIQRSPKDGIIYACSGSGYGAGKYGYIYESSDNGDTWVLGKTTLPGNPDIQHTYPMSVFQALGSSNFYCVDRDPGLPTHATIFARSVTGYWVKIPWGTSYEAWGAGYDDNAGQRYTVGDNGLFRDNTKVSTSRGHDLIAPQPYIYYEYHTNTPSARVGVARRGYGLGTGSVHFVEGTDIEARIAKSASNYYIAYGISGDDCKVYRSATGAEASWDQLGEKCPSWGGDHTEIYSAEYSNGNLYIAADGLWKCPASW